MVLVLVKAGRWTVQGGAGYRGMWTAFWMLQYVAFSLIDWWNIRMFINTSMSAW